MEEGTASQHMISMEDPIWFPPLAVMYHGNLLRNTLSIEGRKSKKFRKVIEAYTVAQMLAGIMVKEDKEYWMQLVDDKTGSPDIRTVRYSDSPSEKFDFLEQVDVEVIEYESHSTIPIPEFIVEKKFSKHKSYDENTVILCHVGNGVKLTLPKWEEIRRIMEPINSSCQVILLASNNPEGTELSLISLRPTIGVLLRYNPVEELLRRKKTPTICFTPGTRKPPVYSPTNKHYPFEKLGYIPNSEGEY